MELIKNDRYEILTENGFRSFSGIKKSYSNTLFLRFSDNSTLRCTFSHKIKLVTGFVEAHELQLGDETSNGLFLIEKYETGKKEAVYDLLDAGNENHYITNNVTSHNCAFIQNWEEFYTSVYPTISSGKKTKMLFTSTPNGLNHYYKFWVDAKENRNGFAWVEVKWDRVPGRDDQWKQDTLASMSFDYDKFSQEFEAEFMGSSGTLIAGSALKALTHLNPIYEWDGFTQYEVPIKNNSYMILCDVGRGKGLDFSAFHVIDITKMPYRQVATYRSNVISPTDYAFVINKVGLLYNTAYVLVEINDIGGQVADLLFDDFDYDNLLFTENQGQKGKILCGGGAKADRGIRTTTSVKAKGCSLLKLLIEQQQLIIQDFNTINELSRFSKKGKSYEAEDGHDDLVMGLVLFAWSTLQTYFANLTDVQTMHNLREKEDMDDFVPFGYILTGEEEIEPYEIDKSGTMWMHTDAWNVNY